MGEEATKRLSRKSFKKSTDGELFIVLNEHLGILLSCGNMNCDSLNVLTDQKVQESAAKILFSLRGRTSMTRIELFWSGTSMLLPLGLGTNTCGISYHTMQPGPMISIVFVHPRHINYAHLGCVHCWALEISDTDQSEAPLPAESCHVIRKQERRTMWQSKMMIHV